MGVHDLTERQRSVMDLIASGKTNREIAADLFLAEKTVKNVVSEILAVLGVSNRTAATLAWQAHARSAGGDVDARRAAKLAWDRAADEMRDANPYR